MRTDMYAIRGRVVTPRSIITDGAVVIAGDAIAWVGESTDAVAAGFGDEIVAADSPTDERFVLPGLIDIHNHGGGSELFPSVQTREQVMRAVMDHRRHGTTSMVASLVTASPLVLRERAELLADVCDDGELAGIHFEGPFVAQGHCGAQDPAHIQSPNPALTRELMVVSRGHCVAMTIAHEKPYAMGPSGVAETLIEGGAIPSFGHTDANAAQTRKALREVREMFLKASHPRSPQATVTHLFNGMAPPHHRDPGPVFEFLADAAGGGIVCELIGDGVHLDPHIVTTTYELIGREQIVFVTDSIAAGFEQGSYSLGSTHFTIGQDRRPLMPEGGLAGGAAHLIDVVRTSHQGGIPLVDAVFCASGVPARILGKSTLGTIEVGKQADLLITDADLRPLRVIRRGKDIE
ncbi:MAG: amidohydrolase family protein [Actinomycetaceae bacterium]|nr:amidohydrolase family protein [Actinomycetaceae bacterium]